MHGLVAPLRLDEGMSVLLVGGADHDLMRTFASHGAEVLVLEADADAARVGGELSVSLEGVRVVASTISAWIAESGSPGSFDLVVYRDEGDDGARDADLDGALTVAASLLRPSGLLLVAADNPVGLSRLLGQPRSGAAQAPSAVARHLHDVGLPAQRWLVPYPDDREPASVVDAALLEQPEARDLIRGTVRDPIRSRSDAHYPTAPLGAFHDALDAGLAAAVCDRYVVLACRTAEALEDATRAGRLWLMPEAGTAPAWQRPRELIEIGGRWLWHPLGSHGSRGSGPLLLDPATLPVTPGRSGEDLIMDALIGTPGDPSVGSAEVTTWATAALAAFASSEPGRYALDLRPRHFIVDADGRWHYQLQDLTLRFPAPPAALLFGAMLRTLSDSVLACGWLRGIHPETTLAEATREILAAAGIDTSDALEYIWVELAVDVLVRTHDDVDRDAALERVSAQLAGTLAQRIDGLPHDQLLAAGRDAPALSAEVARLTVALEAARAGGHSSDQPSPDVPSEPPGGDARRRRDKTVDVVPTFESDDHYLAVVTQVEPWRPALDELLAREGIAPHGSIRVATTSAYPTFFVPPDHYAKIYLERLAGHERHADEVRALRRLERDPGLPVPTIVGEGRLGDHGRYLVMTRLPGKDVDSLRASLDEQSMVRIIGWSGAFLRRMREVPLEAEERDEAWEAAAARLAELRITAASGLRTRSGLPEHLIREVKDWLPTGHELLESRELLTLTHGAFGPRRVIVDSEAGVFAPTGVIDFNASIVSHPMWDCAAAWAALRTESNAVVDAFMHEAAFPGFGTEEFPKRALAWAILQGVDDAYALPDMDAIGSLDELATAVFGRANASAIPAGSGADEPPTMVNPGPVPIAAADSEEEWMRLAAQAEPWLAATELVSRRTDIKVQGTLEHLSGDGQNPVVLLPPDHVVKYYSKWRRGPETAALEALMLGLLESDASLPVPRLVAEGEFEPGVRYLMMSRVPGVPLGTLGREVGAHARLAVAAWTGDLIRRLQRLPIDPARREAGWRVFDERARWRYAQVQRFCLDRGFSASFVERLGAWMPSVDEMMGAEAEAVVCHADLNDGHLLGELRDGRFEPTGVIDFNQGFVGARLADVGALWWTIMENAPDAVDAFLSASGLRGLVQAHPEHAATWILMAPTWGPDPSATAPTFSDPAELVANWFGER